VGPDSQYVTARPAPPLRAFIERYVGYRLSGFAPGVHRGLPSRYLTFIVSIGPTVDVIAQADPHQAPASYHCVVSGLQGRPATIGYGSHQEGVQIDVSPLGARVLFGMPSRVLWDTSVECSDVVGRQGGELWERLQGLRDWSSRFAVCDEMLMRWADADAGVAPELSQAWHLLVRSGGTTAVGDLAGDIGWSRQHLARRFGEEFGLGPKLAARVLRFARATTMLRHTPSFTTIAQVAASCGYFDQSHLDRDFLELAGCTPSQLLAEELPSFQDDPAARE
jgi:AraC-like DNA-binding protein